MGIDAPDAEKVQNYVQNMHSSDIFTEKDLTDWEAKTENAKTWTAATTYFGKLYQTRRSYESDMKAHRAGYESTNSFAGKDTNNNLYGRIISGSSTGRSTSTITT